MAANPLVAQGVLNRLVASISWINFPQLNITMPYLAREAIRLALDGETTHYVPTATGAVTSPEPYMMITASAHLIKPQPLAAAYKLQMETNSTLGDGVIRPDVAASQGGLTPYDVINCSIQSVRELNFDGSDAGFVITFRGYYILNSELWLAA